MGKRERGWWYPYLFIAMLGVVMMVNGAMAYFATSTFNGVITENAYEKGLAYNKTLAAAQQQTEMGWVVEAKDKPASAGHKTTVTISVVDKNGAGIDGLDVQALADRPNVTGADQRVAFVPKGKGLYSADVEFPEAGQWDFDILAAREGASFEMQRRFLVP